MFWIVIYVQNLRWLSKVDDTTLIISAKICILMHCLMNVYANVKVITLSESFTFCITFLLFVLPVSSGSSKSLKVCFFNPTFMRWTRVFKQNPWDFQIFLALVHKGYIFSHPIVEMLTNLTSFECMGNCFFADSLRTSSISDKRTMGSLFWRRGNIRRAEQCKIRTPSDVPLSYINNI